MELTAAMEFSNKLVASRKRNNHNSIKKDDSTIVEQIEMTGAIMNIKNQINKIKHHAKRSK